MDKTGLTLQRGASDTGGANSVVPPAPQARKAGRFYDRVGFFIARYPSRNVFVGCRSAATANVASADPCLWPARGRDGPRGAMGRRLINVRRGRLRIPPVLGAAASRCSSFAGAVTKRQVVETCDHAALKPQFHSDGVGLASQPTLFSREHLVHQRHRVAACPRPRCERDPARGKFLQNLSFGASMWHGVSLCQGMFTKVYFLIAYASI